LQWQADTANEHSPNWGPKMASRTEERESIADDIARLAQLVAACARVEETATGDHRADAAHRHLRSCKDEFVATRPAVGTSIVATALDVSPQTVRNWIRIGLLPYSEEGNEFKVPMRNVLDLHMRLQQLRQTHRDRKRLRGLLEEQLLKDAVLESDELTSALRSSTSDDDDQEFSGPPERAARVREASRRLDGELRVALDEEEHRDSD